MQLALHFKTYWRRYLRWLLWALAVVCLLILLSWGIMVWYIKTHKSQLLDRLTKTLSEQTGGEVAIKDLSLTLWHDFPHMAIALTDVSLHDSLYKKHGIALADIHNVYLRTGVLGLIAKKVKINKFILSGGSIHLFTDSNGYTNTYLLRPKDTAHQSNKSFLLKAFLVQDLDLHIRDVPKNKNYTLHINALEGHGRRKGKRNRYRLQADLFVGGLGFNLSAGSYLEKAALSGPLLVDQDPDEKTFLIRSGALAIEGVPLQLEAKLDFGQKPAAYEIHLGGKKIPFAQAKKWVTAKIRNKLEAIALEKPLAMTCDLSGYMKFRDTPLVHVAWQVADNTVNTDYGVFTQSYFEGDFTNHLTPEGGFGDPNSVLRILGFKGNLSGIPLTIDTLRMDNLSYPLVTLRARSSFPAVAANQLSGPGFPFRFTRGQAEADIHYRGGVRSTDTLYPELKGYARVSDLAFIYVPRGLGVTNLNAMLVFEGDNLYLRDVNVNSQAGNVTMEGSAEDFFRFYFTQPGKVSLAWNASSDDIDLSMLNAFIGQRKSMNATERAERKRRSGRKVSAALAQLNRVLEESSAQLGVNFKKVKYRHFTATQLQANVLLSTESIEVEQLRLNHAGGTITAVGRIEQKGGLNPFQVNATMSQVAVSNLFYAFENFGQDAITAEVISGRLTASADVRGLMSNGGRVVKKAVNGKVHFKLENGRLQQFSPFLKLSKFIFKKRGLDDVQFEHLEDSLIFQEGRIIIPPLHIQSTAFNMLVQGVYAPPQGTNISITLPLGNPENSNRWKRKGKVGPGIVIHLVARDGPDGNVKIGWDATKRGKREAEELFEETPADSAKKK